MVRFLIAVRRLRALWLAALALTLTSTTIMLAPRDEAIAQSPDPELIVPENRVGIGPIVPISNALSYYDGLRPSPDPAEDDPETCQGDADARHAQVRELARSLPADADEIFKYVRDNVEFEATFGLKKGAAGAVLDGDGNAFDQAHLLVELLRANNICARYVFGTAEASLTQLQDWLGVADVDAAERLFADGGIPVERQGSGLRFAHVWVQLYGASGTTSYDPSFKTRLAAPEWTDLSHVIGLNGAGLRSALAGSGTTDRTYAATTGLDNYLRDEAQELAELLYANTPPPNMPAEYNDDDFASRSLNDLFGIGEIQPLAGAALTTATRMPLSAYPAQHLTWYAIPDRFQTFLSVRIGLYEGAGEPTWDIFAVLPLHIAANSQLWVNTTFEGHSSPSQMSTGKLQLRLDDEVVLDETPSLSSEDEDGQWYVSIDVAQPYAGDAGNYLDFRTIERIDARSTSVIFASAGRSSLRRNDELSRLPLQERALQRTVWIAGDPSVNTQLCHVPVTGVGGSTWELSALTFAPPPGQLTCYRDWEWSEDSLSADPPQGACQLTFVPYLDTHLVDIAETVLQPCTITEIGSVASVEGTPSSFFAGRLLTKLRVANSWLYQAWRARAVTAGLAQGVSQNHASIGVVTSSLQVEPYHNSVTGDQLRMHAESTLSFSRRQGTTDDGVRAIMAGAYSAAANALEGFELQNALGASIGGSVASRFRWSIAFDTSNPELNFRNVGTGPDGTFRRITLADLQSQGAAIWNGTVQYEEAARRIVETQVEAGYIAFIPIWGTLGPEVATEQRRVRPPDLTELEWYNNVYRRGSAAVILYHPITGSTSHLLFDPVLGVFKGGGVTPELEAAAIRRPTPDDLDNSADPWSRLVAVDDREGRLTLTPPPDISFGGSPLAYQRTYQSELAATRHFSSGWRSNHFNELNLNGGAAAQFGDERPAHAAAMLVAIMSALELFESAADIEELDIDTIVGSQLAAGWWTDNMMMSVATAEHGTEQTRYYRAPDGGWLGETPRAGTLTRSGDIRPARRARIFDDPLIPGVQSSHPDNAVRLSFDYDISEVSFVERSPDGRVRRWTSRSGDLSPSGWEMLDINASPPSSGSETPYCDETIGNAECDAPPSAWFALDEVQEGCPPGGVANSALCQGVRITYSGNQVSDNLGNSITIVPGATETITASSGVELRLTWTAPAVGYQGPASLTSAQYRKSGATLWEQRYEYENAHETSSQISYQPLLDRVFMPADLVNPYLQIAYTADDRIDSVTRANGQAWNYLATGRRSEVRDPTGAAAIQWFDRYGRQIEGRDRVGRTAVYTNDGAGRVISVRRRSAGAAANTFEEGFDYAYDQFDNVTLMRQLPRTGESGQNIDTVNEYALTDYPTTPTRVIAPLNRITQNTYDPYGRLTSVDGPAGERSDYFYDTLGYPTETRLWVTTNDYRRTQFDYTYDGPHRGLIRRVTVTPAPPDASAPLVSTFTWNAFGDLTGVTDPRGNYAGAAYDDVRRMTRLDRRMGGSGAALGARTEFDYDLNGRLRHVREATTTQATAWADTEARYTATGRLERVIDPALDADVFTYDTRDWLFSATDGEGRRVEHQYDATGRPTCVIAAAGTGLQQASRSLGYALWDAPSLYRPARGSSSTCAQTSAGYNTTVAFDAYGRVRTTTFPGGTTTIENRNLAGEVETLTDRAGQTHTMTYDGSGRVLRHTMPDGGEFEFEYNYAGERTRAAFTPSGGSERWTAFDYDGFGRLKTERRWDGLDVGYEYDAAGNRTAIVWPDLWRAEYVYDPLNRLTEVRAGAPGSVATLARYQYDARSRRTELAFGPTQGGPVSSIAYTWQIDNDLEQLVHAFNGASVTFDHDYDGSGRLESTTASNAAWFWLPTAAGTDAYGVANTLDQYPTALGETLTWDTRGNLSAQGTLSLSHDSVNRMTSASRSGVFSATYEYDGLGRRILRTGSGTDVSQARFVHAEGEEIAEYELSTNTVLRRYVPGPGTDQPVAYVEHVGGTQTYYYHQDRLGNIIALANSAGQLADQYRYTPYGVEEPLVTTGQPFRYNARRFDAESELYHYRARYFSPSVGRFIETDPLLHADQMNLYAYVGNDPLNATDPTGMFGGSEWRDGRTAQALAEVGANCGRPCAYAGAAIAISGGAIVVGYFTVEGVFIALSNPAVTATLLNSFVDGAPALATAGGGLVLTRTILARLAHEAPTRGGRLGGPATRALNAYLAQRYGDQGWRLVAGGAARAEEYIAPANGGRTGGVYVDITLRHSDGRTLRIQTVDTLADGFTPTDSEMRAINRINERYPNHELLIIPKRDD